MFFFQSAPSPVFVPSPSALNFVVLRGQNPDELSLAPAVKVFYLGTAFFAIV